MADLLGTVEAASGQLLIDRERGRVGMRLPSGQPVPADLHAALRQHKATLLAQPTVSDAAQPAEEPTAATLRHHMAVLWPLITRSVAQGLARHITGVPMSMVRQLIAAADPQAMHEEAYTERCRLAGDVATFCALVAEYRRLLGQLAAVGADVSAEQEDLDALLTQLITAPDHPANDVITAADQDAPAPSTAETAEPPMPPHPDDAPMLALLERLQVPTTVQGMDQRWQRIRVSSRYRSLSLTHRHAVEASYRAWRAALLEEGSEP